MTEAELAELEAIALEWALRASGQWTQPETHEEKLKRYQRDQVIQATLAPKWKEEELRRHQEWKERWEAQKKEAAAWKERQRKAQKQAVFDLWEMQNERGGWKANAPERAARRVQEIRFAISRERRDAPLSTEACLDLLNDHDYIDWMFTCSEKGLRRAI